MNMASRLRNRIVGRAFRHSATPRHIEPNDIQLIRELKQQFIHNVREFHHGIRKYSVDCLYCHAVPGTLETSLMALAGLKEGATGNRLLNLGGGTGQVTRLLARLGFEVVNVDKEIELTSETTLSFDLNLPTQLPVANGSFDFVFCQEVIEHIENPWDLFRKIHLALKPGGFLVLTTPNVQSKLSKKIFVETGHFHWFTPECLSYHINPLHLWEIKLISRREGFDLMQMLGSGHYYFGTDPAPTPKSLLAANETLIFVFVARDV